jgi:hypothetical protein
MDPSAEKLDVRCGGAAASGYVPPQVRALGNVHDLLAGVGSGSIDCTTLEPAPAGSDPPGSCEP